MNDEQPPAQTTSNPAGKLTREARLAAKLRENLRRRKVQARALSSGVEDEDDGERDNESVRLPKSPSES